MKYFKIDLEPKSALRTPLQSDTIFGHFCWCLRYYKGEKALEKFISPNVPYVVFSNGFPKGYLPRPVLDPMDLGSREEVLSHIKKKNAASNSKTPSEKLDFEAEVRLKKIKKIRWIKESFLLKEAKKEISEKSIVLGIVESGADLEKNPPWSICSGVREKNRIDRLTGSTLDEGGLYAISEDWYKFPFRIYAIFNEENPVISKEDFCYLIRLIFQYNGYGADASIGYGHFKVVSINEFEGFPIPEDVKDYWVMSLSNFIPKIDEIDFSTLRYKLLSKYGALGDSFAISGNPFKTPLVMMEAGATFKPKVPLPIFGGFIRDIHSSYPIVQNTALIPLYYRKGN